MEGVKVSIDRIVVDFTSVHWIFDGGYPVPSEAN